MAGTGCEKAGDNHLGFPLRKKFSHYHLASLPRLSAVGTEDILAARVAGIQAAPHRLSPLSPERRRGASGRPARRSEEHTSELQSLMRISYAVFCLKKKKKYSKKNTV